MASPDGKKKLDCPYLGVWGKLQEVSVLSRASNGMPVTRARQALNAAETLVASRLPSVARTIRRFFDRMEGVATNSPDLYRMGTPLFEGFLGPLTEAILRLFGKEGLIDIQYNR